MIYIVLPTLPPSSNQAYFNLPGGGRSLTKAAQKYKKDVVQHIVKHHATETGQLRKDATIGCLIAYGYPDLLTKGWPKKAKARYKKDDLANRPKLLQDAIVEATSMDDSQICFDYKYKYLSDKPQTHIYIWNEEDEPFGQRLLGAFHEIVRSAVPVQSK